MGAVYEAWDPELERSVAIKLLTAADGDAEQRFRREAQLIAALRHSHIVTVHDFGVENGVPFIVMELLKGVTVAADVGRRVERRLDFKVNAMAELCLALASMHAAGAVHRDVKPANVHLGDDGVTRLLDFGVAHLLGSTLTQPLDLIGTPSYLPPEILAGQPLDCRADVFSASATLYEWITFRKPREAVDVTALIGKILREDIPPLRGVWPDCPVSLARAIDRGLARNPDQRQQTALELRSELLGALQLPSSSIASVAAPPVGSGTAVAAPGSRARMARLSWSRLLAGVALLVALGVAVVGFWDAFGHPSERVPGSASATPGATRPAPSVSPATQAPPPRPPDADLSPASGLASNGSKPRPRATPAAVSVSPEAPAPPKPLVAATPAVQAIPVGTTLLVRIVTELRTDRSRVGDVFFGELRDPLTRDGATVVPAAVLVRGRIDEIGAPGPGTGPSMAVSLTDLILDGRTVPLRTTRYLVQAPDVRHGRSVTALVVGAAAGAALGGAAGGKEGAVAGAAAGAAATETLWADRSPAVVVLGDRIPFRLARAVTVPPYR